MTHGGIVIVLQSIQAQNPPSTQSTFREVLMSTVTYNAIGYAAQNAKAPLAPLLRAAMAQNRVSAALYTGRWTDVGTPERLQQINRAPGAST